MKMAMVVTLAFPLAALVAAGKPSTLLQLDRHKPPAFSVPQGSGSAELKGFCKKPDTDEPACTSQPCCCWSSYADDKHYAYPSPEETKNKQLCLNAPEGFTYAPADGTFDDGTADAVDAANLPTYAGRRLCCLRRELGAEAASQVDLASVVPPTTTVAAPAAVTEPPGVPEPGDVNPAFVTAMPEPLPQLNAGDEYEVAQMELAARQHLDTAVHLKTAIASLKASADDIDEVNVKLQSDPNLIRSRKSVAKMKAAVQDWAVRRWKNLKKLESGDSTEDPAPPTGESTAPTPPAGIA